MIPLVYIAGPLGAPSPLGVRQNIERARDVGLEVAKAGAYPVIPHCNTGEFYGHVSPTLDEATLWGPGTMELLRRCDAIVTLPTWEKSVGAVAEVQWAQTHDLPWLDYIDIGPYLREDRLREFVGALVRRFDQLEFERIKRGGATT